MSLSLALSGSAGTGKTTLATTLSRRWSLPFVHEGMRAYLERTGIDLHTCGHARLKEIVLELWEERQGLERAGRASQGFVADRCSVDFAAFWLFYRFADEDALTERFWRETMAGAEDYDAIIVLPWGAIELVADGVRTPNRWTQLHYQSLVESLLRRAVPAERLWWMPDTLETVEQRADWVEMRCREHGLVLPG